MSMTVLIRRNLRIQIPPSPIIRQRLGIPHGPPLNILAHGNIQIIQLDPLIPIPGQILNNPDSQPRRRTNRPLRLRILAPKGDGDPPFPAGSRLQSTAHGAGGEVVDGGGVAAVVGAGDDEVDGAFGGVGGEEVEEG